MEIKIIFAAGGTGGHLFPAQALAQQLEEAGLHVFFAGVGLDKTEYFNRLQFSYQAVEGGTPARGSFWKRFCGIAQLVRGIRQSLKILSKERPKLVIGFGSFHAFPVLCAALLKRIPIVLFESNAVPGKVVRLFSRCAKVTALYFPEAKRALHGKTIATEIPSTKVYSQIPVATARQKLGLDPDLFTLLVFGGSQGAKALNQLLLSLLPQLKQKGLELQLIHFTGNEERAEEIRLLCETLSIPACVKKFETHMDIAWSAADLVLCRSGAATLSEMIHYAVPGILIPYPYAADRHQTKNAEVIANLVGGAKIVEEGTEFEQRVLESIEPLVDSASLERKQMQRALQTYRLKEKKENLASLVLESLHLTPPASLSLPETYHFIGIGGIGMSALAQILLQKGERVSGTDLNPSPLTEALQAQGALVASTHAKEHVPKRGSIIYSTDIKGENPEIEQAKRYDLKMLHRSELLAELMRPYRPLLVSGTHGKTTTSALLSHLLAASNMDPSFAVGGIVTSLKSNGGYGRGDYFVAEADESDGSFLNYSPFGAIVTNCDDDHLDHWKTTDALRQGFAQFAEKVHSQEHLFWCGDDPTLRALQLKGTAYGWEENNGLRIVASHQEGWKNLFSLTFEGKSYESIEIPLIGKHNVLNAAAVFGMGIRLGLAEETIRQAFLSFQGIARRAEYKGNVGTVPIFDDYAHHPTEIETTLNGLKRAIDKQRLVVIFQPHRYTRTRDCFEAFGPALQDADLLVLTDIYAAREAPIENITIEALIQKIQDQTGKQVHYAPRPFLSRFVSEKLTPEDVIVTLGAGDITKLGSELQNEENRF